MTSLPGSLTMCTDLVMKLVASDIKKGSHVRGIWADLYNAVVCHSSSSTCVEQQMWPLADAAFSGARIL